MFNARAFCTFAPQHNKENYRWFTSRKLKKKKKRVIAKSEAKIKIIPDGLNTPRKSLSESYTTRKVVVGNLSKKKPATGTGGRCLLACRCAGRAQWKHFPVTVKSTAIKPPSPTHTKSIQSIKIGKPHILSVNVKAPWSVCQQGKY